MILNKYLKFFTVMEDIMTFEEYQKATNETAIYPNKYHLLGVTYAALGLAGEAGEIANKIKKLIRDHEIPKGKSVWYYLYEEHPEKLDQLHAELGDCLWYLAQLAVQLGFPLNEIATANYSKLLNRKNKGTLQGEGDDR